MDHKPVEYEQHSLDIRGSDGPAWLVTIEIEQSAAGGADDGGNDWRLDVTI